MTMVSTSSNITSFREQSDKLKAPSSPIDENTKPPKNAPAAAECWKAMSMSLYVPSGDQRLVLSAIDNQLNANKIAWREKRYYANNNATTTADAPADDDDDDDDDDGAALNNNNNNNNSVAKEEFFLKCMDQTGESLKRQLESITIPANESELERTLNSFHTRIFSITQQQQHDDDDDESSLSSIDDDDDDDESSIDFDDNEIVDRNAHDQVKSLRIRAREISARVISVREETAGRALDMTRRNLSELMSVHGFAENAADDNNNDRYSNGDGDGEGEANTDDNDEQRKKEKDGSMENNRGVVLNHNMHIAFQTLTTTLSHVDSNLTEKLVSMKETIGTIDASVEKYQKLSQGDESVLSRTEKALLFANSGETPSKEKMMVELSQEESELPSSSSPMNSDKKLACLLAGVL